MAVTRVLYPGCVGVVFEVTGQRVLCIVLVLQPTSILVQMV